MSHAQTADRIVAGDLVASDMTIAGGNRDLRERLTTREAPVVVADNVAEYVHQRSQHGHVYRIGEWPCLAPPWDWAWIEYPSATGNERRGVWMLSFDLLKATPDERAELNGMIGAAIADASEQSPGEVVRWALILVVFADSGRKVHGPVGTLIFVLDEHGKELGNRWFLRREGRWAPDHDEASWLCAAALPALQTIAFAHCRNVAIDRHQRPAKLAKAHRRRHGHEPLRWQTVRLELPRSATGGEHDGAGTGARSLHIVAGHFSHYGDCCPTQHDPKGKLFGRLEGVYWMPMHLRGDPTREVRSEHVVQVGPVSDPSGGR